MLEAIAEVMFPESTIISKVSITEVEFPESAMIFDISTVLEQ
jgi:hypothetical protein